MKQSMKLEKKEDQKDSKSTANAKEKKSNVTGIRSSNKILQGQEQDQNQT